MASEWLLHDLPSYFLEAGATNGVELSNTHLLETRLGWGGLVVEPAKVRQRPSGPTAAAPLMSSDSPWQTRGQ